MNASRFVVGLECLLATALVAGAVSWHEHINSAPEFVSPSEGTTISGHASFATEPRRLTASQIDGRPVRSVPVNSGSSGIQLTGFSEKTPLDVLVPPPREPEAAAADRVPDPAAVSETIIGREPVAPRDEPTLRIPRASGIQRRLARTGVERRQWIIEHTDPFADATRRDSPSEETVPPAIADPESKSLASASAQISETIDPPPKEHAAADGVDNESATADAEPSGKTTDAKSDIEPADCPRPVTCPPSAIEQFFNWLLGR